MRVARRLLPLVVGGLMALGLAAPVGRAGEPISGLVSDHASDSMPSVPGGQCYTGTSPDLCRRIMVLKQVGNWIYAGGIISSVTDRTTGQTISGFHNIFRFNATTGAVDSSWKPQFYKSAQTGSSAYMDSAVTGIASNGNTIYVSGEFTQVAPYPGAAGVVRNGVAALSATNASVLPFNAQVCVGGGNCRVYNVAYVNGTLWLGGLFEYVAGHPVTALAFVNPVTGALTGTQVPVSGQVTSTVGTKVWQFAINPQQTQAVMIGNFTSVGGASHWEVAVLDINSSGTATIDPWNDPTNLEASNSTNCNNQDTWARGVDWDPTGTYFDIASSGGRGFDGYGDHRDLCDAFSRFKSDGNPNTPYPLIVNETGYDSLYTVDDTGQYVYTGGHNKSLDHAVYVNGVKVDTSEEHHYGIGAIDVDPSDPGYGEAVAGFNASTTTGRGAGWDASLSITGYGVFIGGDSYTVGSDTSINKLAFFPVGSG